MKIVRLIPLACLLSLLAACGNDTVTGPDPRDAVPAATSNTGPETAGNGTMGSGG